MSSDDYSTEEGEGNESFAFHDAAEAGDAALLAQLLEARQQQLRAAFAEANEDDDEGAGGSGGGMDVDGEDPEDGAAADADVRRQAAQAAIDNDPLLSLKDWQECTPLHVAIVHGHPKCVELLIQAKSKLSVACDGCPPVIMAVCTAAVAERRGAALEMVKLLLDGGADILQRDDMERTALHWAAEVGLSAALEPLLSAGAAARAELAKQQEEDAAAAAAAAAATGADPSVLPELPAPPALADIPDANGDLPLHLAARFDHADVVAALLVRQGDGWDGAAAAQARNKLKETPLHVAARHGCGAAAAALLAAAPGAAEAANKHGFTPADLAARRGHEALAALLRCGKGPSENGGEAHVERVALGVAAAAAALSAGKRTLLYAPHECMEHFTSPQPVVRGAPEPPPENIERLAVLADKGRGCLWQAEFEKRVEWAGPVAPAAMADILRVHEWNYVRGLQAACASIPDLPSCIGRLDGDTAISHRTFLAARVAAGSVCEAVDKVVAGEARNAFCAVRPPGHHSGPRGVVPSANDPNGSHGFCLINNVALGAAYAVNIHRRAGIKRVALLDFDVHHGNGTEAIVANTAPRTQRFPFSTPLSEGVVVHQTWQPWLGEDDEDNIFFASVQGYGSKVPGSSVYVYPGSGDTADTEELRRRRAAARAAKAAKEKAAAAAAAAPGGEGGSLAAAAAAAAVAGGAAEGKVEAEAEAAAGGDGGGGNATSGGETELEEDPDHEFASTSKAPPPIDGPRIIDVGIGGPGFHPLKWRRAWRDKILPALVKFHPDIIMVSAGFDAHKKDEINFRYIGVTEADYEWLTDQIVQIANRCCSGRVVSVLEGGYNLRGSLVSAFSRSVAAHVRALAEPHAQAWDAEEARAERGAERRRREERAAKHAARVAKAAAAAAAEGGTGEHGRHHHHHPHHHHHHHQQEGDGADAAAAAAAGGGAGGNGNGASAGAATAADVKAEAAPAPAAPTAAEGGGRPKRRRGAAVDYVALNAEMEKEEAEARAAGGAKP